MKNYNLRLKPETMEKLENIAKTMNLDTDKCNMKTRLMRKFIEDGVKNTEEILKSASVDKKSGVAKLDT